jgi:glycolate oxidase FAD binding subunit
LIRLEGEAAPLTEKTTALQALLKDHTVTAVAEGDAAFANLANGTPFVGNTLDVWRIAAPPTRAASLILALSPTQWTADAAGGVLWLGMSDSESESVHTIAAEHEGHATLVRASEDARAHMDVFPPLSPERLALTKSVKAAFDPLGLFNPNRMYNGV